jgi:hypothetical protein
VQLGIIVKIKRFNHFNLCCFVQQGEAGCHPCTVRNKQTGITDGTGGNGPTSRTDGRGLCHPGSSSQCICTFGPNAKVKGERNWRVRRSWTVCPNCHPLYSVHECVCNDEIVDAAAATLVAASIPFVVADLALHRFRPPYGLHVLGGDVKISSEDPRYTQGPYDVT